MKDPPRSSYSVNLRLIENFKTTLRLQMRRCTLYAIFLRASDNLPLKVLDQRENSEYITYKLAAIVCCVIPCSLHRRALM